MEFAVRLAVAFLEDRGIVSAEEEEEDLLFYQLLCSNYPQIYFKSAQYTAKIQCLVECFGND